MSTTIETAVPKQQEMPIRQPSRRLESLDVFRGLTIAGMNAASRRQRDLLWTELAAGGVVLLAPIGNIMIDPLGMGLALVAGGCWAA